MREALENRLAALRQELASGNELLADLRSRQVEVEATVLRIGGAIQVIEELLEDEASSIAPSNNGDRLDPTEADQVPSAASDL